MRRVVLGLVLAGIMSAAVPVYAAQSVGNDTAIDQVGDWVATLGKSGLEKEALLTQRKAQRAAKRAEASARRQAKQAEKGIDNAGKELNKGLKGLSN